LFFLAAITSLQRFALYFFMYAFKIEVEPATTLFGRLITVVGVFTLASALVGGWLADRFNHKLLLGFSGIAIAGLIVYRHRANISNLLAGRERRIGQKAPEAARARH
jgi:glycerol-3-phosphate acyltransferase PlsY